MTLFAEVVLPLPLTQTFSYIIPEEWRAKTEVGKRVLVPFGERVLTAFVVNLRQRKPEKEVELKEIREVLDENPVFSPLFFSFTRKVSDYYNTSWGDLLQASLPPSFVIRSKTKVFLSEKGKRALEKEDLKEVERALLTLLEKGPYTPLFIQRTFGVRYTSSLLSRMEKRGFVHLEREVKRKKRKGRDAEAVVQRQLEINFSLDSETRKISERIIEKAGSETFSPFLIFGPKERRESVYFHLIRHIIARGQRGIFLVPEISSIEYPLEKMRMKLGKNIALLHSQMSERRREQEWRMVQDGGAGIVVGSRSALFSQVSNLGLIIVDDEHDDSYYQRENPTYDARKAAWLRAREEGALLIFGSEQPTVETFYRAKKGGYLLSLEKSGEKRKVFLVDERRSGRAVGEFLKRKIEERLNAGEPMYIFLNRRGYAPLIICSRCNYIPRCPRCHLSLTYHKKEEKMLCHSCNFSLPKLEVCPECGGRIIRMMGAGIEAVEEELKKSFPTRSIASLASDEVKTRRERESVVRDFGRGKIDILLGTQLLAHQTGLPEVSFVGILHPETLLGFSDYRASQKTYQTIRRMMSFCRDEGGGQIVIQTAIPHHFCLKTAASHDYLSFFNQEIKLRRLMNYPPFSHLVGVVFQGGSARALARRSREFRARVEEMSGEVEVLGPGLGLARGLRGGSSIQMILRAQKENVLDRIVRESLRQLRARATVLRFWG